MADIKHNDGGAVKKKWFDLGDDSYALAVEITNPEDIEGGGGGGGGLTDAELRATPVDVAVTGNVTVAEPVTVDGTVELGAAALAALETVDLGATTLSALENITAGISGSVEITNDAGAAIPTDPQKTTPLIVTGNGDAVNETPIAATEVLGRWVSVHITGTFVATYAFEISNDNANWTSIALADAGTVAGSAAAMSTGTNVSGRNYHGPVSARYFRVRISAYTSGQVDCVAVFSAMPSGLNVMVVDSELPGPAALADAAANPTTPTVGSGNLVYNGATWDRARGDTTNGLDVDVTRLPNAATPAQSSVNDTASSTTLLASNASRKGATIYNDSTVALYLKLGATASTTSFTIKLAADGYFEVPFGYTGVIDGIWASDASGAARITELT